MKTSYLLTLFIIVSMLSCMEDEGNYNYVEINRIELDTIQDRTIELYDTLVISPIITLDYLSELNYCWYRYTDANRLVVDTLSIQRDLNIPVTFELGEHVIYFHVTEKQSGLSEKSTFKVNVVGKFNEGLMVLSNNNGCTNLHFINNAMNLVELYDDERGVQLGTNPRKIANAKTFTLLSVTDMLVLCGDTDGGKWLKNEDFSVTGNYNSKFFIAPSEVDPQSYYRGIDRSTMYPDIADFIINKGKLHIRTLGTSEVFGELIGFNPYIAGDYVLSPYALVCGKCFLFYDNKNGSFLSVKGNYMSMNNSFSTLESSSPDFKTTNMGMTLVYMAEGASTSGRERRGFAILKDNVTNKLYRYSFLLDGFNSTYGTTETKLFAKDEVPATGVNIEQSDKFAMSLAKPYLYYAVDNTLYCYDLEANTIMDVWDVNTLMPNSTIDCIYLEYAPVTTGYGAVGAIYNNNLYVGTSQINGNDKAGSMYVLSLNTNGTVDKITYNYENKFGKIVSMCYKR